MSLSSWLRDYLYIPLGGNRKGKARQYVNLFLTMLIGGLWHGANFTFVVWGALHGAALAIDKLRLTYWNNTFKFIPKRIQHWFGVFITFHFVCFCWIFFKADSFNTAFEMIHQITDNFNMHLLANVVQLYKPVIVMMLFGFTIHAISDNWVNTLVNRFSNLPTWVYVAVFTLLILVLIQFKTATPVLPIYLQF